VLQSAQVNAVGAWPEIAKEIGLPDSVLDKGSICRRRYKAARLDEFTEVGRQAVNNFSSLQVSRTG